MKPNSNVTPLFVMVTVGGQFAFRLIALYIRTRIRFSHVMSIVKYRYIAIDLCTKQFSGKFLEPAIVGVEHLEPLPERMSLAICENSKEYILLEMLRTY